MNTLHRYTCAAILATGALLTGCESLEHYAEYAQACDLNQGGSQYACNELARDRASEAEYQRRKQEEEREMQRRAEMHRWQQAERLEAGNLENEAAWARQAAAGNDQDHALVRATYPGIGSLSGVWCAENGDHRLRVEVLSNDEILSYFRRTLVLEGSSPTHLVNGVQLQYRLESTAGPGRGFRITHRSFGQGYQPMQSRADKIEMNGEDRLHMSDEWWRRCTG